MSRLTPKDHIKIFAIAYTPIILAVILFLVLTSCSSFRVEGQKYVNPDEERNIPKRELFHR